MREPNKVALLLWAEALESGEFPQGSKRMFSNVDGTFCCLGVACVVAQQAGIIRVLPWTHSVNSPLYENALLPNVVAEWYGLDPNPAITPPSVLWRASLLATEANDRRQMSFIEIARRVREMYGLPATA